MREEGGLKELGPYPSYPPPLGGGLQELGPYPSYPPPLPLWALKRPRRKFEPFFGIPETEFMHSHPLSQVYTSQHFQLSTLLEPINYS